MTDKIPLDVRKATQVVYRFVADEGGKMNHLKLMKLLYLADRAAFTQWGMPVIGDRYCSMEYGPMLSGVLDLINHNRVMSDTVYWDEHISRKDREFSISNISQCDFDELSEREIRLIDEISERFKNYDEWQTVSICHSILKEWTNPGNMSITIKLADMLKATGKTKDEIEEIKEERDAFFSAKQLLCC